VAWLQAEQPMNRDSIPGKGKRFFLLWLLGAGGTEVGAEADHSPSFNVEVKNGGHPHTS
jgi:hypothetical protein